MKKLQLGLGQTYLHFRLTILLLQIGQKSHQFDSSSDSAKSGFGSRSKLTSKSMTCSLPTMLHFSFDPVVNKFSATDKKFSRWLDRKKASLARLRSRSEMLDHCGFVR